MVVTLKESDSSILKTKEIREDFIAHAHKAAALSSMHDEYETSDSDCPATNDHEFWSEMNLDSLSASTKGAKLACAQPIADKRARHKLVERRRRDKTRAFVEQLQSALPNIEHNRPNPNVNFVLEKTLHFLQSISPESNTALNVRDGTSGKEKRENMELVNMAVKVARTGFLMPIDDISSRRYMFAFDNAPLGIVISRIDGVFLKANQFFRNMFRFPQGSPLTVTMFSLTASQDLAMTMKVRPVITMQHTYLLFVLIRAQSIPLRMTRQAASTLLNGGAARLSFTKECIRPDGRGTGPLHVDMT